MKQLLLLFSILMLFSQTAFAFNFFETSTTNQTFHFDTKQEFNLMATQNSLDVDIDVIENASQNTPFLKGLYYGFIGMLVLLCYLLVYILDDKTFFRFGNVIISVVLLFLFKDGFFSNTFKLNVNDTLLINSVCLLVFSLITVPFSIRFLQIQELFPNSKFIIRGLLTTSAISIIMGYVTEPEMYALISNVLSMAVLTIITGISFKLFKEREYIKFFVIGAILPMVFAIDYYILQSFSISFLNIELMYIKGVVLAQILLMMYAIVFRKRELKEEKEIEQIALKIYLKNKKNTARQKTELFIRDQYLENIIMNNDLSGAEIKLLQYISEGKPDAKIIKKLQLEENEFDEMTSVLYQKLEVKKEIIADYALLNTQPDYIYN